MSGPSGVLSSRRTWISLAGLAGVAGLGAYALGGKGAPTASGLSAEERRFWASEFERIDGQMLPMQAFRGRPLVVNFWATWCPPCIAELPLFNAFFQENQAKSWQVLGLAVDQPSAVKRFIAHSPLVFPVALAGMDGVELSRSLGNLSGGLPFSVVFGASGAVRHRKIGRVEAAELRAWQQSTTA